MSVATTEQGLIGWLNGRKTYIVAAVTFIAALVHAWSTGNWGDFAPYTAFSAAVAALRNAISKTT